MLALVASPFTTGCAGISANPAGVRFPIHQHEVRHDVQPFHGLLHPAHGGVEDVVPVDDLRPHKDDFVGQRLFNDLIKQGFPLFSRSAFWSR